MKGIFAVALSAFALQFAVPVAQAADSSKVGYLTDKAGNIVTGTRTGLCIRTKHWTPQNADPACLAKAKATKKM